MENLAIARCDRSFFGRINLIDLETKVESSKKHSKERGSAKGKVLEINKAVFLEEILQIHYLISFTGFCTIHEISKPFMKLSLLLPIEVLSFYLEPQKNLYKFGAHL